MRTRNFRNRNKEEIESTRTEGKNTIYDSINLQFYVRLISSFEISHDKSRKDHLIKSQSENNNSFSSEQPYLLYSKIKNDLDDEINICLLSGKHKVIVSASERMSCRDFIDQSVKLVYDFNSDFEFLENSNRKGNLGIWMECQSVWMNEEIEIGAYSSIFSDRRNVLILRKRKTLLKGVRFHL